MEQSRLLLHTSCPLVPGNARGERAVGGKYPPALSLPGDRSTTDDLLRKGAACASCSLMLGGGSSGCRRCENEVSPRGVGVVGVKSDCDTGSGGGSSFSKTERWVARRVMGLCAGTDGSALEETWEGFGKVLVGRSSRNSVLAGVTGELSTASRTGSKAGISRPRTSTTRTERLDGRRRLNLEDGGKMKGTSTTNLTLIDCALPHALRVDLSYLAQPLLLLQFVHGSGSK